MGYVGRGLNQTGGQYRKIDDISSGFDGSETSFTLKVSGVDITPTAQNVLISINGVIQEPGSAYSMNGSTITFTGAPDGAASFFGVVMGEASYIAFDTVGANEMGVTEGHVSASRGVVVDSSKNVTGFNQVTSTTFSGIFSGALSSSAQIATNISGSITESSASFSTRVTNTESSASQLNQDLKTSASPTFTGGTYTSDLGVSGSLTVGGTIVAQEFKTEFVSASITFTSGSTIFGDTIDDVHNMTGSLFVSGNINLPDDAKINFGSSDDGNIKHSGTNLQIQETTGNIQLINYANDKDISLSTDDGSGGTTAYITLDGSTTKVEVAKDTNFAGNVSGSVSSTGSFGSVVAGGTGINSFTGNVGIGTDNPSDHLQVSAATARVTITSTGAGNNVALKLEADSADGTMESGGIYYVADNTADSSYLALSGDNSSYDLTVAHSGNVGINETAPITKLDVRLDSTSTDLTNDYSMFINNQTGASTGRHATMGFGTYNNGGLTNVFGAVAEGSGAQSGFTFLTHNGGSLTEKVRIANDGKVGVLIDGTSGLPSSSLHIRANEPNIILQDMNHAPASSVALNANSSTAGLEIGADVQGKYSGTTISFQIDGTERVKFEDAATEYTAEFKGDVKILDNNSDPRLLIGDSTSANEYGEVSYDSSENELRLGIQGNEDTIVMDSSANVEFKSMVKASLFRTDVTTTSVANASWTNISGLTSLSAGLYIIHVYKDNYAANDWSARGIVEATGHSTIDGDFENQTGFQLRVNGSDVQLYHTLGSTFGITARWIKIG